MSLRKERTQRRRTLWAWGIWVSLALVLVSIGTWVEVHFLGDTVFRQENPLSGIVLFFVVVNLNVFFILFMVFYTFRSGVKLTIDRSRGTFGSSLRTKLVSSFLLFSLLPTVILLYVSTKFVDASLEKWLPPAVVKTHHDSQDSETQYQNQILKLMEMTPLTEGVYQGFDFVFQRGGPLKEIYLSEKAKKNKGALLVAIGNFPSSNQAEESHWVALDTRQLVAVRRTPTHIVGLFSPPTLHPQWRLFAQNSSVDEARGQVDVLYLSYWSMLGVLTMLIVFSATWLGFTVAREFTIPLQVLAAATEQVAQGDYSVQIDDIVSDDEMGRLALSFRSMMYDLKEAKADADNYAQNLRQKADELFEKSEYNAILLRNMSAAVIVVNQENEIETWNHQAEILFQKQEQHAIGKPLAEVLETPFWEQAVSPLLEGVQDGRKMRNTGEYVGRLKDNDVQLLLSVTLVVSAQGRMGRVLFVTDVTELSKAQRIAAWRDVARRIAHEIKNPLTPIKLGAQRLERKFKPGLSPQEAETFQECIAIILHSTASIKNLVDEFILFARMPQPNFRECQLAECLRLAVASFQENPENIPVHLSVFQQENESWTQVPMEGLSFQIRADFDQMNRLFVNLIANAVSAATYGGFPVEVSLRLHAPSSQVAYSVLVADRGPGVPDEMKVRIFEPYFSTKRTGMGIGLVIVQQIAKDHGVQLELRDTQPRGATFVLHFPRNMGRPEAGVRA